jgi:acetolactate synthase-1/2/3 large subunit
VGYKTVEVETTAQACLELLRDRGVEYFFANSGTDFAPLIDAFARFEQEGKDTPKPVTVPHENAAMAMAHGYYLVTGKPQVVMVHVNVGTANAMNGVINAARDNIPIILMAGRTPITESDLVGSRDIYIHWAQESFDQASMLREYVKWDYELRNFTQLEAVFDRAFETAMTPPMGPVYVTLPREVISEKQKTFSMSSPPRRDLGKGPYPDPQSIETAAEILAEAKNPLIITTTSGRDPDVSGNLVSLSESFAIPVVTVTQRFMCFPSHHPLHLGFTPDPFLDTTDALLVIDSAVPWYPGGKTPSENCKIIHVALDPLFSDYPVRTYPSDLSIRAETALVVPGLTKALLERKEKYQDRIEQRFERVKGIHDQQRLGWQEVINTARNNSPLDPNWISHCINQIKNDETIIVNEYDLVPTQVMFDTQGSYFGTTAAGGLGWGLGASIGVKLAAPEKLVIAVLGDGSYLFGNPVPSHFVSRNLDAPTLTVIFNNGVYNAVRFSNLRMYPQGWAAKSGHFPLAELRPSPDYEVLVTACGGYGERVEKASEVLPALERAVKAVKEEGRQVVLNMIC